MGLLKGSSVGGVNTVTLDTKAVKLSGLLPGTATGDAVTYEQLSGSGTVTSVSVVSANGLAGTVANATTTPAITLSTSINSPVLAGNGTALIAATTTGSGSTVVLSTSPTFVTDISAPKIISSTASGGLLLCNNNGVTVASFGVGSAGSTNIALIGATAVTGTISGTSSLTLGTASTTVGSIVLNNATNANTITIQSGVTTSSHTLTLPVANASGVLTNNGSGTLTWAAASSGITVGTTTITSGTTLRVPYNNAGVYSELANFTMGSVATGVLDVPVAYGINGTICFTHVAGNNATALRIGSDGTQSAAGSQTIMIGNQCGNSVTGAGNLGIGWFNSLDLINGVNNIAIGTGCRGASGTVSSTLIIGANTYASWTSGAVSNDAIIGENGSSGGYKQFYFGQGKTKPSPDPIQFNVTGGSGTNNAGGNFIIAAGKGTGTAAGGTYKSQTSVKGSSGTTLQSLTDRHTVPAKYVDITDGAATTFGNLALTTSGTIAGGIIVYTVEANDGTDYQSLTGTAPYSVVNKAGTLTYVLGTDVQSSACSTGTLTGTLGLSASGTTLRFQMNAVSSLTETVLRISFQVLNQFGEATITAA